MCVGSIFLNIWRDRELHVVVRDTRGECFLIWIHRRIHKICLHTADEQQFYHNLTDKSGNNWDKSKIFTLHVCRVFLLYDHSGKHLRNKQLHDVHANLLQHNPEPELHHCEYLPESCGTRLFLHVAVKLINNCKFLPILC